MPSKLGLSASSTYHIHRSMLARCSDKRHDAHRYYGGRGIKVCDRWHDFMSFISDMGLRPPHMTLDRIDTNGNYCKENCRWVPHIDNVNNTRRNVWVEAFGERKTVSQWSRDQRCRVGSATFRRRLRMRTPPELALTAPVHSPLLSQSIKKQE